MTEAPLSRESRERAGQQQRTRRKQGIKLLTGWARRRSTLGLFVYARPDGTRSIKSNSKNLAPESGALPSLARSVAFAVDIIPLNEIFYCSF